MSQTFQNHIDKVFVVHVKKALKKELNIWKRNKLFHGLRWKWKDFTYRLRGKK